MKDGEEATDGPSNPQLHPEQDPGFDVDPVGLEDIEVDCDVTIGKMTFANLDVSDTEPVKDHPVSNLLASFTGDGAVEHRRAALALVERENGRAIVEALSHAMTTDEDARVRQLAVEALAKHDGDFAVETA